MKQNSVKVKRPKRYWITYVWTLPYDLCIVWPTVLLLHLLWGKKLQWITGLWTIMDSNSWFVRTLYKGYAGTTLGHGGFLISGYEGGEGIDTPIEFHEDQHVEQYEGIMLSGLIFGGFSAFLIWLFGDPVHWWLHAGIWLLSWMTVYCCTLVQAWIRGEEAYKGASLEEAAYALADEWERSRGGE